MGDMEAPSNNIDGHGEDHGEGHAEDDGASALFVLNL